MALITQAHHPAVMAETISRIEDGLRSVQGVNMVDMVALFLDSVRQHGQLSCRYETADSLRFVVGADCEFVATTSRARSRIRQACANISVRCGQLAGRAYDVYGGSGDIVWSAGNAADTIHAEWVNTPSQQEFTLSAPSHNGMTPNN